MSDETIWRAIPSYFGYYEASSRGEIRRIGGQPLKPIKTIWGYHSVHISIGGAAQKRPVHQLVCEAFHGARPSQDHQVAHGNGVRTDNRAENLRWATAKDNAADRTAHGRKVGQRGMKHHHARLTPTEIADIRRLASQGVTQREIANRFGTSQGHISRITSGVRRKDG